MENWKNEKAFRSWQEVEVIKEVEEKINTSNLTENEIIDAKYTAFHNALHEVYGNFYEHWQKYTDKHSHTEIFTKVYNSYLLIEIENRLKNAKEER